MAGAVVAMAGYLNHAGYFNHNHNNNHNNANNQQQVRLFLSLKND